MAISYEGIGQTVVTMMTAGQVEPGMAVALTAADTVGVGTEGALLCGVVLSAPNGMAAVQLSGLAEVGYAGTAPGVGWASLALNGSGKVKTVSSGGRSMLVLQVDQTAGTVVICL